jgi:hypothetical protein
MPSMQIPRGNWTTRVVDELLEQKRRAVPFDDAWQAVLAVHPPRSRDDYEPMLFDEREVAAKTRPGRNTFVGFFREACRVAWHGEQPALRHFTLDMLAAVEDDRSYAARRRAA